MEIMLKSGEYTRVANGGKERRGLRIKTWAENVKGKWRKGNQQRLHNLRGINGVEGESGKSGIMKAWGYLCQREDSGQAREEPRYLCWV